MRRPTPGLGYLETLAKGNVRVVEGAISQVLPDGVKLPSGEVIKVDSIVCATGFDVSWKPRFPVIGRGGVDLAETWKDRPTGYLGLAVADLPNYFGNQLSSRFLRVIELIFYSVHGPQFSIVPWFCPAID